MRILGLTGGIGAGKSLAAKRFTERGVPVIDADRTGHETIEPGGSAEQAVREAFGDAILTEGRIDREKLGAVVFNHPEKLQQLNAIVHPAVGLAIAEKVKAYHERGCKAVLIEAALHAENGELREPLQGLILVTSPLELRVARLTQRRGMSEDEARRRIAAQRDPEEKLHLAQWVIHNDGDEENLYRQVDEVAGELLA
jgi:dephospho-CoA kinase